MGEDESDSKTNAVVVSWEFPAEVLEARTGKRRLAAASRPARARRNGARKAQTQAPTPKRRRG